MRADLVPHDLEIREAADHLGDAVADGAEVDGEELGRGRGRGDSAGVPEIAEVEVWEDGLGVGPVEENVAGSSVSIDDGRVRMVEKGEGLERLGEEFPDEGFWEKRREGWDVGCGLGVVGVDEVGKISSVAILEYCC